MRVSHFFCKKCLEMSKISSIFATDLMNEYKLLMKQIYSFRSFIFIFSVLLCCVQVSVHAAEVRMAAYTPIPMSSTSAMLPQSELTIVTGTGWTKPGTWEEPYNDDSGGGSSDKPSTWDNPFMEENPDDPSPIGEGWVLLVFAAGYAGWMSWKRKKSAVDQ